MFLSIILATTIIGLISIIGVFLVFGQEKKPSFLKSLISLAAGSLLAAALLDLLPEAIEGSGGNFQMIFGVVLISILFFFLLEKYLHWHHCRCDDCSRPCPSDKKNLVVINLVGDGVHNLIDGFLVASAFMLDFQTGLIVTAVVILHEIPQEISDFGVLLYAGLSKTKALLYNLAVGLTAIAGAVVFYFFGSLVELAVPLMAAFAAGNFIYLATADLIPELNHETDPRKIATQSIWLLVGVAVIFSAINFLPAL